MLSTRLQFLSRFGALSLNRVLNKSPSGTINVCRVLPVCECGESILWPSSGRRTGEKLGALETEVGAFSVLSLRMSWCTGGGPVRQKRPVFFLSLFLLFFLGIYE